MRDEYARWGLALLLGVVWLTSTRVQPVRAYVVACPVDCGATPNVQAELDACIEAERITVNEIVVVNRDTGDWLLFFGSLESSRIAEFPVPPSLTLQATGETFARIECATIGLNETRPGARANSTIVFLVCLDVVRTWIPPELELEVVLTGACSAGALSMPATQSVAYTGPATIVGAPIPFDADHPANVVFDGLTFDGGGTTSGLFGPCGAPVANPNNITIANSRFVGFAGDCLLRFETCLFDTRWEFDNNTAVLLNGSFIDVTGAETLVVTDNECQRCANSANATCIRWAMSEISRGELVVTGNSCWRLTPPAHYCFYFIDGAFNKQCIEGEVRVFDELATERTACSLIDDLDIYNEIDAAPAMLNMVFDPACRVFSPPSCNFCTLQTMNGTQVAPAPLCDIFYAESFPLQCVAGGTLSPLTGLSVTGFSPALGVDPPGMNGDAFTAGVVSSAPFIANSTCDCASVSPPPPPRDVLAAPCAYALEDGAASSICVEELPICCAQRELTATGLCPHVLTPVCDNAGNATCVLLTDCAFVGGLLVNCTERVCAPVPFNGSVPLDTLAYADVVATCSANVPAVVNGSVVGSLLPNTTAVALFGNVVYVGVERGKLFCQPAPEWFFLGCNEFGNAACTILSDCAPLALNATGGTVALTDCTRYNCTAPPNAAPTLEADFASCAPIGASGSPLALNASSGSGSGGGGGWSFLLGAAIEFAPDQLQAYLAEDEALVDIFTSPRAALAPACAPLAWFKECTCNPNTGTFRVPPDLAPPANFSANETIDFDLGAGAPLATDAFYTCTNGAPSCACDEAALNAASPPPRGATCIWVDNGPDTLRRAFISRNRCSGFEFGMRVIDMTREQIVRNSVNQPQFDDARGRLRELGRNINWLVRGSVAAFVTETPGSPYAVHCNVVAPNRPCPHPFERQDQFQCVVDDRADDSIPGFGSTIFETISEAFTADCITILVRQSVESAYYDEDIVVGGDNANGALVSFESAVVVGVHRLRTKVRNYLFQGLHFFHPADQRTPLFSPEKFDGDDPGRLASLVIKNCNLFMSGCRKCGVLSTRRLADLVINDTLIDSPEFIGLEVSRADSITLARNRWVQCIGRCIRVSVFQRIWFEDNALIEARGGEELRGAAVVEVRARTDNVCDGANVRRTCLFRNNVQIVSDLRTEPLFRDVCFQFTRGSIPAAAIYDNWCRMGVHGFVLHKVANIALPDLPLLIALNPGVVPSLNQRRRDRRTPSNRQGDDWVVRSTVPSTFFEYDNRLSVDRINRVFDLPGEPIMCRVNRQFKTHRFAALGVPRMGLAHFPNVSLALATCQDRRLVGSDFSFVVDVQSFDGSRAIPDVNITQARDAWLRGDDAGSACRLPAFKPCVESVNSQLITRRQNQTDMCWLLPPDPLPFDMWGSGLTNIQDEDIVKNGWTQVFPVEICWERVEFNGRQHLPNGFEEVVDFVLGELANPEFFKAGTTKLQPFTETRVDLREILVANFVAFNADSAPDGAEFLAEPGEFPYTGPMRFRWINRVNTESVFVLRNSTFRDLDYSALHVLFPTNITVEDNRFFNCSGRGSGNTACVRLEGNDVEALLPRGRRVNRTQLFLDAPSALLFDRNQALHTRDVLFPRNGALGSPGWVGAYETSGFPNTTYPFCVRNDTAFGLPLGLRYKATQNITFDNCPSFVPGVFWPDRRRYVRSACNQGQLQGLRGSQHWIADGNYETDIHAETVFCDFECCPLADPPQCFVMPPGSALLTPANPWFGVFVFGSINAAVVECQAAARTITIVGADDPFRVGETAFVSFTEVVNVAVPIAGLNATGPMLIRGTAGMEILASGHSIDTQGVETMFEGIVWRHDGGGPPLWTSASATATRNLRFVGNKFDLDGHDRRSHSMLVGDGVTFRDNSFRGRDAVRSMVVLDGNATACDARVQFANNVVHDVLGDALRITGVSAYEVRGNQFLNTGGRDTVAPIITWGVFLSVCTSTSERRAVVVRRNLLRTTQTSSTFPPTMHAGLWLDPVPLRERRFVIEENDFRGMEIGIRFCNLDPLTSPSSDPKQQLRGFALDGVFSARGNILSKGTLFDLVEGCPADDVSLFADPDSDANVGRWCNDGCPINSLWIILSILIGLCVVCTFCCLLCAASRRTAPRSIYDPYLDQAVPLEERDRAAEMQRLTDGSYYTELSGDAQPTVRPRPRASEEYMQERAAYRFEGQQGEQNPPQMLGAERSAARERAARPAAPRAASNTTALVVAVAARGSVPRASSACYEL